MSTFWTCFITKYHIRMYPVLFHANIETNKKDVYPILKKVGNISKFFFIYLFQIL
jgi:hypothetical protein